MTTLPPREAIEGFEVNYLDDDPVHPDWEVIPFRFCDPRGFTVLLDYLGCARKIVAWSDSTLEEQTSPMKE